MASKKLRIELVRSRSGRPAKILRVLDSLGLAKLGSSRIHDPSPGILGKLDKVIHLVRIEETEG